jgi:hypothetical protein
MGKRLDAEYAEYTEKRGKNIDLYPRCPRIPRPLVLASSFWLHV